MIIFVPAIYGGLKQFDSVIMPIYKELIRRGIPAKWGTWKDGGDIYLCSNPYDYRIRKNKLVYYPHGMALQDSIMDGLFKGILFPSQYWKDKFLNYWSKQYFPRAKPDDIKYPVVGWAKSDIWFNIKERTKRANEIRTKLRLPYDKTVLFGGCYGGFGVIDRYIIHGISGLIDAKKHINIIFKGHALTTMQLGRPISKHGAEFMIPSNPQLQPHWRALKNKMDKSPNCNFIDPLKSGDIFDLFLVSDVYVSGEGSSTLIEFMITGRPTIQLGKRWYTDLHSRIGEAYVKASKHNYDYSTTTRRFGPPPQIFMAGLVSSVERLSATIDRSFKNPTEFSAEVKAFLEKMVYKPDGHASERCADALERML